MMAFIEDHVLSKDRAISLSSPAFENRDILILIDSIVGTDAVPSAPEVSTAEAAATVPAPASAAPTAMGDETPYPSSFARVVELITTGQPIPGIQQIPDTVLVGQGAPSVVPPRRKPWEKDEPVNANEKGNEAKKEHGDIQAAA